MKTCTKCFQQNPETIEFFYAQKNCKNGLTPTCRPCTNAMRNDWRRRNSALVAEKRRIAYATRTGPGVRARALQRQVDYPFLHQARVSASSIRERCKEHGFSRPAWATVTGIHEWLLRQPNCECCLVAFHIGPKGGYWHDASPSFDRLYPSDGYELSNVSLICWRCNNIKRNYQASDLRAVAAWIDRRSSPLSQAAE